MVSIVIPTYQREGVLLETLEMLLSLPPVSGQEILVVDQSKTHERETEQTLVSLHAQNKIRWIRLEKPSITAAMNLGMRMAVSELVLFLDDDIEPITNVPREHAEAHAERPDLWATVGQVIQPWQKSEPVRSPRKLQGLKSDFDFPFYSSLDDDVGNVMAGNLCVRRERVLSIGGFDENFRGAAFRFETEFARRVTAAGGHIRFLGSAGIRHLRVSSGGTRNQGSHLTSASPHHGIGDHYYAFLHGAPLERWVYSTQRVFREVCTKFHLTHPWWIPVKLVGEVRAMWGGWKLARRNSRQRTGEAMLREPEPGAGATVPSRSQESPAP